MYDEDLPFLIAGALIGRGLRNAYDTSQRQFYEISLRQEQAARLAEVQEYERQQRAEAQEQRETAERKRHEEQMDEERQKWAAQSKAQMRQFEQQLLEQAANQMAALQTAQQTLKEAKRGAEAVPLRSSRQQACTEHCDPERGVHVFFHYAQATMDVLLEHHRFHLFPTGDTTCMHPGLTFGLLDIRGCLGVSPTERHEKGFPMFFVGQIFP